MKSRLVAPLMLVAGMAAFGSHAAMASNELTGALLGAGAGALVGHAVSGREGAVVGGFLGAMVGAAASDHDDRVVAHAPRRAVHGLAPVVVYGAPRGRYAPPPIMVAPRPVQYAWRFERDERRHERRDERRNERRNERGHDGGGEHRRW